MNTSLIARNARLEAATETLAEYIGYLNSEIDGEQRQVQPNADRVGALGHELDLLLYERRSLTPGNRSVINRALYVYAPLLKSMHGCTARQEMNVACGCCEKSPGPLRGPYIGRTLID